MRGNNDRYFIIDEPQLITITSTLSRDQETETATINLNYREVCCDLPDSAEQALASRQIYQLALTA
ncbi:hypothetical protein A9R01_09720 ['Osedax' symbiont bacterium Rs2_46_30_T18]|nr:hypothetical protein A9R01_09720 ['Osedax' symbiont bacterium Rs2_46_30_T18]